MKKTVVVLLIAALLTTTIFAAKKDKKAKTMNISVFTLQQRQQPPADNRIFKWLEEKFGVTFSWDILVGDADQKIGILIASGDLPDVVEVNSERFQAAGCLIDLYPLVKKYCPNLMKHYASVWDKVVYQDSETAEDGSIIKEHVYSLPNYGVIDGADQNTGYGGNAFWIQKAVLKEFNYPKIQTVDEYFDLLEKYAKKYPTINGAKTLPFTILSYDWEAFDLWNPPQFLGGNANDGNGHVVKEGKKYVYYDIFTDANAKRWFKLANGYYNRGLIDPASFTDNKDQYIAKLSQGRVLGMFIQGWQFQGSAETTLRTAGMYNRTYAPLAITFDKTIKPHYRDQSLPNLQRGWGITTKAGEKKAIEILKFMDELIKDENMKVLQWGQEGIDWQKDAQGRPSRTKKQRDEQADPNWILKNKATLWYEHTPKLEGSYKDGLATSMDNLPWEFQDGAMPEDVELWNAYGVASYAALVDPNPPKNDFWYPMWQCNPAAENDGLEHDAAVAMKGFENIQKKYLPKCIMAKTDDEFESIWAEYCKLMKPLTETYNKFMQQQLDARVKIFGKK